MILDGYIRVSQVAGRSGERFISPTVQRDQIERYAKAHGHRVGVMFAELDESGGRADRPLLLEALERQERREAQVLCVAKLDRFGRSTLDGLAAIDRVIEAGGAFVSVGDDLDFSSPTGRLFLRLMLSVAEWELDRVRDTWAEAQHRAIARGVHMGSLPLGYRRTKAGRLVVDPATAPLVRALFARRLRGASPTELARWLTEQEVPTFRGGNRWDAGPVRSLIARRVYLGEVRRGSAVNPDAHEPLVDAATRQAAQIPSRGGPGPRRKEPALLHGLPRCAGCGRVLSTRANEHGELHYLCLKTSTGGTCPAPAHIRDSVIEPYVEAVMWGLLKGSNARTQQAALSKAELQATAATDQLVSYRDHPTLIRTLGPDRYESGLAVRRRREEQALLAVADARAAVEARRPGRVELQRRWAAMGLEDKRRLIASTIDCVFVFRGRARDRLWAIPKGCQPADLPTRAPVSMPSPQSFVGEGVGRARPAAGTQDWTRRKVITALRPLLDGRSEWPRFAEFQAAGLGLAHANARRHATVRKWCELFGVAVPVKFRPMPLWSSGRVRRELTVALQGWNTWPTMREFRAMGQGELRKAVQLHGGAHRWAQEFGLPLSRQQATNRMRWSVEQMENAVRELAAGQSHWPPCKQFEAAGLTGLYETINRAGIRRELAERLRLHLPEGPHYRAPDRWTDEAMEVALTGLLHGRTHYPTLPEFSAAGLAGLHQVLGKAAGGHGAIAARFGLERVGNRNRARQR